MREVGQVGEYERMDRALEAIIHRLIEIEHHSGWQRVHDISQAIAPLLGEANELSEHGISLRRLAAHPHCPLNKTQLHETMEAARVFREEPLVQCSSFLTPSHAATVARLDVERRHKLLLAAENGRWSVRELSSKVRQERRRDGERRGRPPTSHGDKAITRYDNAVLCLEEAFELLEQGPVSHDEKQRIVELLERVRRLYDEGRAMMETSRSSSEVMLRSLPTPERLTASR